jgi:hypothetical protein
MRMRPDDLCAAMDADLAMGRLPFLVAAVAGSTNTGAVDDLPSIAEICRERGVWLHVDAAYGGFAALTERGRNLLPGLDLADSVTLDPHKWLLMPFEVGCLMVRSADRLEQAFSIHPEYLAERAAGRGEVDFADRGLQLTRASRAIKVWLGLQAFGVAAYREAIDRALDLVLDAQRTIENDPRLELVTPASLGIVSFRCRARPGEPDEAVDRRNAVVVARLAAEGGALVTATQLRGRYAIRLCVMNHATGADDVAWTLDRIATLGEEADDALGRGTDGQQGWLSGGLEELPRTILPGPDDRPLDPGGLRRFPSFAAVTDEQAERFLATGRVERCEPGDVVTEVWAFARTVYLVLEGSFTVEAHGREVNTLRPGDHFGEIAAIEWGRDFNYGRTATVTAIGPSRVIAVPGSALRELMAESPLTDRAIRLLAQARLLDR